MHRKKNPFTFRMYSDFFQLLALIRRGHYEDVIHILRTNPEILKLRDRMGRSALHHCADSDPITMSKSNSNVEIGQAIVRLIPKIVEWQDNEGNIALHLAIINANLSLVESLLHNMSSVQINIADYELHNAIHWCVVAGQLDAMTMALKHGADPSTSDIYGAYPLHYATQNIAEYGRLVATDIEWRENVDDGKKLDQNFQKRLPKIANVRGKSYSKSESRLISLQILHKLLSTPRIDVNCTDHDLRTPLIWAASSGNNL